MDFIKLNSGDVFAVEIDADTNLITESCGPLYYKDINPGQEYDMTEDDNDWLNDEDTDWIYYEYY